MLIRNYRNENICCQNDLSLYLSLKLRWVAAMIDPPVQRPESIFVSHLSYLYVIIRTKFYFYFYQHLNQQPLGVMQSCIFLCHKIRSWLISFYDVGFISLTSFERNPGLLFSYGKRCA